MIFAAVLPQFVDRGEGHVQVQMLLLGLLAFCIGLGSDSVWALAAARLRTWFDASPRPGEAMGAVGGLSMIGLGRGDRQPAVTGRADPSLAARHAGDPAYQVTGRRQASRA